jgi:hypothetical protein
VFSLIYMAYSASNCLIRQNLLFRLLGAIAIVREEFEQAACLLGAADALRTVRNAPVEGMDADDHQRSLAVLSEQLDSTVFQSAWQTGQALSLAEIVKQATEL